MFRQFLSLTTCLVSVFLAIPAFADVILPGGCSAGTCWEQKFLSKTPIARGTDGTLYAVELASRSWSGGASPPARFEPSRTSYVYCSITRPTFIFQVEEVGDTYFAHLLNPGGDWHSYNVSAYPVYWATCHNFVGPDFFSEEMTRRAIQLGYPLDLPTGQIELNNFREILN